MSIDVLSDVALPEVPDQHAFNVERWNEIMADPEVARLTGRVETNEHGQMLMTPPPGFYHCERSGKILRLLDKLMPKSGTTYTELPVSTSGGVRAMDVGWISRERLARSRDGEVLKEAPEICVEVLSPGNTRSEVEEKVRLFFEAGADEVWLCDLKARMSFFLAGSPAKSSPTSALCQDFPRQLDIE